MRAIVQRVSSASVTVDDKVISSISKGLMVLVGIGTDDTEVDVDALTKKILTLKIFPNHPDTPSANGTPTQMWKSSVKDIDGAVLCVSQFTLMANTGKGSKPDFHRAMPTEPSKALYATFLESMRRGYKPDKIFDGKFGAMMSVSLTNEGPVTFTLDSRKFEYVSETPGGGGGGGGGGSKNNPKTKTKTKVETKGGESKAGKSEGPCADGTSASGTTTGVRTGGTNTPAIPDVSPTVPLPTGSERAPSKETLT